MQISTGTRQWWKLNFDSIQSQQVTFRNVQKKHTIFTPPKGLRLA